MTNNEILQRWNDYGYNNLQQFDLSNIYSVMFFDRDTDIDDFLETINISKNQLINNTDPSINQSLQKIDEMIWTTSHIIRDFIVDYVFSDTDEEEIVDGYGDVISDLREVYTTVEKEFDTIRVGLSQC